MVPRTCETFYGRQLRPIQLRAGNRFLWISGRKVVWKPLQAPGPTIDQLAAGAYRQRSSGKLNVDDNQNTAIKFQIRGIPAVLLFKNGQIVESVVGLAPAKTSKTIR